MGCCSSTPHAVGGGVEEERERERENEQQWQQAADGKLVRHKDAEESLLQAESKADALLAIIPGRMVSNGASDAACVFTQQGRKGTNQDAMVVWEGYASMEDTVFCGVFDGHGPFGHLVARRVRDSIPSKLVHYWEEELAHSEEHEQGRVGETLNSRGNGHQNGTSGMNGEYTHREEEATESGWQDGMAKEHPMFGPWKESHLTAYKVMDKELRAHPGIDCFCSGTTAVTVLKQGKHLVIGNVGDSRAILGTKNDKGEYVAVQLTVDLKPNLPREAERIRQCRGRVFALHDEPEVPRVWLPFDDSPGLAMARAFGDFCLKDYGVIAVPEMSYRQLTDRDQFIVLATDGIWDVLSNDEVVQVVAQAPTRATATRALVEAAVRVWRLKYPTSKVDDCAVVCLYVDRMFSVSQHVSTHHRSKELPPPPPLAPLRKPPVTNTRNTNTRNDEHLLYPPTPGNTDALGLQHAIPHYGQDPQTSNSHGSGEITTNGEGGGRSNKVSSTGSTGGGKHHHHPRKLADWLDANDAEEEEWSALEGVTRVNSLLNLPRFKAGDKRAENNNNSIPPPQPKPSGETSRSSLQP